MIADSDVHLGGVIRHMLVSMGFSNIHVTQSGTTALNLIRTAGYDLLITDWNIRDIDGIELLRDIRRSPQSPNPTMPVVMLTGRMDIKDVRIARDEGVHEYVLKPFSAKSLYQRLERTVESPRPFIVGKNFVGPDRRSQKLQPERERRERMLTAQPRPMAAAQAIQTIADPIVWSPDRALKQKLGTQALRSIITPEVLTKAQGSIDTAGQEALKWIAENLAELRRIRCQLAVAPDEPTMLAFCNAALMLSSRAGTFGYQQASEVAAMLYSFCRQQLVADNIAHGQIVDKHLEVLQFFIATNMRPALTDMAPLKQELKKLIMRHAPESGASSYSLHG